MKRKWWICWIRTFPSPRKTRLKRKTLLTVSRQLCFLGKHGNKWQLLKSCKNTWVLNSALDINNNNNNNNNNSNNNNNNNNAYNTKTMQYKRQMQVRLSCNYANKPGKTFVVCNRTISNKSLAWVASGHGVHVLVRSGLPQSKAPLVVVDDELRRLRQELELVFTDDSVVTVPVDLDAHGYREDEDEELRREWNQVVNIKMVFNVICNL